MAPYTCVPCGPPARVVSLTKSRKIPTRQILPLCFVRRACFKNHLPVVQALLATPGIDVNAHLAKASISSLTAAAQLGHTGTRPEP